MSTRTVNAENFEATITQPGIVLVDFWASWCSPCRMFVPVFEAAARQHPDIVFAKVDTEAEPVLAQAAGISSIPTLVAFRDGILVYSQAGALPAASLEQLITAVRALDVTMIRALLGEHRHRAPAAGPVVSTP